MRVPRREQGLKDMARDFKVPTRPGEMGPSMRDTDRSRGPLEHVPDNIMRVQDFGAPMLVRQHSIDRVPLQDEWTRGGSTTSPASATFTAGKNATQKEQKATRSFPESQLPGSFIATY